MGLYFDLFNAEPCVRGELVPVVLSVGCGAGVVGSQWLLPKLKQLPEGRLSAEAVQQRLLAQHSVLAERITGAP